VKVKHAGKEFAIKAGSAWDLEIGPITIAQLDAQQAAANAGASASNDGPVAADVEPPAGSGSTSNGSGSTTNGTASANNASGSTSAGPGSVSGRKPPRSNARKALEEAGYDAPPGATTDDPKAAIASYQQRLMNMPEGEDKEIVLYGIAVMQHLSKHDAAAKHTLSGVLKRQGGPAYKSALWLNVRINCLEAFDDECRIAANKYLAKVETGRPAGVAQEILKEISRGQ
jgi:hypothetical protein